MRQHLAYESLPKDLCSLAFPGGDTCLSHPTVDIELYYDVLDLGSTWIPS